MPGPQMVKSHSVIGHLSVMKSNLSLLPTVKDVDMSLEEEESGRYEDISNASPIRKQSAKSGDDPSTISPALAKLRHRSGLPAGQARQPLPVKKRPKMKHTTGGDSPSGLNEGDQQEKDAKRIEARKALQICQKFEMVEPHPLFAKGRYGYKISERKEDVIKLLKITQVKEIEQCKFLVRFENEDEEEKKGQKQVQIDDSLSVPWERIRLASRVFSCPLSDIEHSEKVKQLLDSFFKEQSSLMEQSLQKRNLVLVTQLVETHDSTDIQPNFAALLPSFGKQINLLPISIKDEADILKSLIDLDDTELSYESFYTEYQSQYTMKSDLNALLQVSETLNKAFSAYENATSKIVLTKDNLETYLYTSVHYTAEQSDPNSTEKSEKQSQKGYKQGVYLRAKFDPHHYNDNLLFIKKLGTANSKGNKAGAAIGLGGQKEIRNEWLLLQKYKVLSDVSRGFISLECLNSVNQDGSNRLKMRNIKYIGYRESMKQRMTLRDIAHEAFDQKGCEVPLKAQVQKDSTRPGDRCLLCNYQAQGYDHLRCNHCSKVYHEQCILMDPAKSYQLYLGVREQDWRCPDCIRCVNCLTVEGKSQVQQLLICKCCNSAYHYECMDPNMKLSMPKVFSEPVTNKGAITQLPVSRELEFHCERCVQCEQCGKREAGQNRSKKWSKDFKLCSNCNLKRKKKQCCQVCEGLWPDFESAGQMDQDYINQITSYLKQNMIACGQCGVTVHYECDRIFEDPNLLERFKSVATSGDQNDLQYHCQGCRQASRQHFINSLIESLASLDKYYIFQDPVEDQITGYTKIIKTPMCFAYVKKRAQEGMYLIDTQAFKRDISLIFENAMKFNLPKHKVHKEAEKLLKECTVVIDTVLNRLELNEQRTKDENKHKDWFRLQRKFQLEKALSDQGLRMIRPIFNAEIGNDLERIKQRPTYILQLDEFYNPAEFQRIDPAELLKQQQLCQSPDGNSSERDYQEDEESKGTDVIKKGIRFRKQEFNEGSGTFELVGSKRGASSQLIEGEEGASTFKRISSSSKRARFNQQQLKGTSLLSQALNHQSRQQDQQQSADQNDSSNAAQASQPVNHLLQQQQMMMTYYQEIDDERCYYSNPARCSFDDPQLIYEEMCYLCGSFGKRCDFLSCTLCGESFHTYCLQLASVGPDGVQTEEDDQALIAKFQPYWKCLNCKYCEICSSATQEASLLYCDVCDKAFHSFCLTPALKSIPKCQWKCDDCFNCSKCGAKSFFDYEKHLKQGTNQLLESIAQGPLNDFEFSDNFSLCYECGMNEHKKSFCKICQQSNQKNKEGNHRRRHHYLQLQHDLPEVDQKMLKCNTCGYYSHYRCSRLLPQFEDTEEDDAEHQDFKCLECLLTGKSINHLIRESCEHYENMHAILTRQKLLGQLCTMVLASYIPSPEKAPLFIKAFIEQNQEFFKHDSTMNDWISLLETGVTFPIASTQDETAQKVVAEGEVKTVEDQPMKNENVEEEGKVEVKLPKEAESNEVQIVDKRVQKEQDWSHFNLEEVYALNTQESTSQEQTPAQVAYKKMYSHKEGFIPEKRDLYEALNSEEGFHRFGQRKHFMDPFAQETQALITLPLEDNLAKIDFARLYVDNELKAVMKLKLKFFAWFESMISAIVLKHSQRQLKKRDSGSLPKKIQEEESQTIHNDEPESQDIGSFIIQDHPSGILVGDEVETYCTEEDVQIDNPQRRLHCVMCKLKGELTVTGRLIPFQVNQFVHVNCALWSTDVHEIADGGYLVNFFQVWSTRAKFTRCWHCGEAGASVFCHTTRVRCLAAYHFPCAYRNKMISFGPKGTKETFCEPCCKGHKGYHLGLPSEFANTKRRFQIAKNQQPWNMTHHMISQYLQLQSQQAPALLQNSTGSTSAADIEKPLQIEKWRPFYFDMFNRVGNLTILSLKKEINQIIEEYCTSSKTAANSNDLNDFSTVRIYWHYFLPNEAREKDVEMSPENRIVSKALENKEKAIYLYHGNSLRELPKGDLEALLPYVSYRIKEKVNLGLHYLGQDVELQQQIKLQRDLTNTALVSQQDFWNRLINYFKTERKNFSLQNIIFSISEFSGKTKYPVSIWNRAAENVKNKIFFLRSGEQVLQHQGNQQDYRDIKDQGSNLSGTGAGSSGNVIIGFGSSSATLSGSTIQTKKGDAQVVPALHGGQMSTIDDIFRRMTKINQMGEHQNPMASIKRVNASKHMQYEAVLHNLGKRMFYKAPPTNTALFEDLAGVTGVPTDLKAKTNLQAGTSSATAKSIQKKIRQTDTSISGQQQSSANQDSTLTGSKESDLPVAMKYRLSKTQPKRVEVGPSKIHRNGLFTLEDLQAGDIVIEYVGERIRNKVADKREIEYEQKGFGDCYLFRLDREYIIDATFNGNKARYLNHSCDASCFAKVITVQQHKHIIICANRNIKSGEELTYNYNFDYEADKIECFCGAPGCLGRLN